MPTLPAPDHDRASAEWIVNDVWLSYPDLRAWLAGAFVSNEQLYAEYVNAVEVINADLMVLRQFRRSARDEDMARAPKLARLISAELPGIPLVQRGPTVGLLATAGRRLFLGVAGQVLAPYRRNNVRGTWGIYVNGRLHRTPFLPPDAEPYPWPATPNLEKL